MNKKLNFLFLVLIFLILSIVNVKAEEYSVDVDYKGATAGASVDLYLKGIETIAENADYPLYYVHFANENDPAPVVKNGESIDTDFDSLGKWKSVNGKNGFIYSSLDDWYMLEGYDYLYVVKETERDTFSEVSTKIKIEKPPVPPLGQKYEIFIFDDDKKITVFPYYPSLYSERTTFDGFLELKVGVISDNFVLNNFRNNSSDKYLKLMEYAKSADGKIYDVKGAEKFSY